ncbi:Uu.00g016990.m01.CDS01 [Anthostomella pinea]|uniref:Uu.00g016990.m01.CDS01 n=1 Tax=Anthostomella pinea TaxID=933095 RepID=A0AAI8YQK4_9PEZI|nr:Uu.00g016990.m01.CDS01 [Anthostomella pinea]
MRYPAARLRLDWSNLGKCGCYPTLWDLSMTNAVSVMNVVSGMHVVSVMSVAVANVPNVLHVSSILSAP